VVEGYPCRPEGGFGAAVGSVPTDGVSEQSLVTPQPVPDDEPAAWGGETHPSSSTTRWLSVVRHYLDPLAAASEGERR
jgi:hypothetical protein